ncbi:hypothetical protein BaRGS_00020508 [Batillaria attramentaria]|uniref:Uncharacterized protein n=1 Tax=Batillaria attramentaria TaxID=370345 RepID=A0ABD0KLS6_9CAEN
MVVIGTGRQAQAVFGGGPPVSKARRQAAPCWAVEGRGETLHPLIQHRTTPHRSVAATSLCSADAAQNATDADSATLEEGEDKDHDEVARQMTHTFRTPADWLSYARDMNRCDGGNQWAQQSDMNDLNAYGVGWGGWDGWNDGQSEMAAVWGTGQEGLQAGQDKTRCFVYGETILGRETVSITDGIYSQPYSGAGSQWPQWMTRNRGSYYSPRWWSSSGNNQMWPTRTIPGPVWSGGQMSGFPRPDSDYRQRFFPVSSGQGNYGVQGQVGPGLTSPYPYGQSRQDPLGPASEPHVLTRRSTDQQEQQSASQSEDDRVSQQTGELRKLLATVLGRL